MQEKVLVVDDEKEIRNLLSDFLTREGYEVLVAANGHEALELASRDHPHVILLDIKMPGMDGIETCGRLKAKEDTRSIPIIIATAFKETLLEVMDAGADDFVTKPFHLAELAIRLKAMLRVRHLLDELERAVAYIQELEKSLSKD